MSPAGMVDPADLKLPPALPARTAVGVASLPDGAWVELELLALVDWSDRPAKNVHALHGQRAATR